MMTNNIFTMNDKRVQPENELKKQQQITESG